VRCAELQDRVVDLEVKLGLGLAVNTNKLTEENEELRIQVTQLKDQLRLIHGITASVEEKPAHSRSFPLKRKLSFERNDKSSG